MAYIALKNLRFGDGWLAPGDPVPVEPGRNYAGMVRTGLIADAPQVSPAPTRSVASTPDGTVPSPRKTTAKRKL